MVAPELTEFNRKESSMELEASYPVVVTDKLIECRDFYTRWFGFRVVFEATWFVYLTSSEEGQHGIAFMTPDHPSRPPGPEAFDNESILLTFQVPDAASEFERVRTSGLVVDHPLRDEPWGQRRFGLEDPAGVWVDVWSRSIPSRVIGIRTPDRLRPPRPSDRACARTRAPCRRPHASRRRSSARGRGSRP